MKKEQGVIKVKQEVEKETEVSTRIKRMKQKRRKEQELEVETKTECRNRNRRMKQEQEVETKTEGSTRIRRRKNIISRQKRKQVNGNESMNFHAVIILYE